MPANLGKRVVALESSSYCSAPPLTCSSRILLPPCPATRAEEARRPRAPLKAVKAEVRESEVDSVEFVVDDEDHVDVKPEIKVELNPRQLHARVAAIATSSDEAHRPEYQTQPLCRIPHGQLGPAGQPRGHGRPKGSKSRPRIEAVHGLPLPPVRLAAAKARMGMTSSNMS